jgi:hypothetical protein
MTQIAYTPIRFASIVCGKFFWQAGECHSPDYSSRELPLALGPFGGVFSAERREPPGFPL